MTQTIGMINGIVAASAKELTTMSKARLSVLLKGLFRSSDPEITGAHSSRVADLLCNMSTIRQLSVRYPV
jgi:hypothetical protein